MAFQLFMGHSIHPPPLTEPVRNAVDRAPTVRNSGAAFTSCTIGRGSVAFLPGPVKGWLPMPLAQNLRAASG